ncbi:MAG: hypothetical protein ACRBC3_06630 [Burkholderiaceae bacterium]
MTRADLLAGFFIAVEAAPVFFLVIFWLAVFFVVALPGEVFLLAACFLAVAGFLPAAASSVPVTAFLPFGLDSRVLGDAAIIRRGDVFTRERTL